MTTDYSVERDCDATFAFYVQADSIDKAMDAEKIVADKIMENHQGSDAEVILDEYEASEGVATFSVEYAYSEEVGVDKEYSSHDYYEPDEPMQVYADEASEVVKDMGDDIKKAFRESGFTVDDHEVVENRTDSLETLYDKAKNRDNRDFDYDRY